VGSGDTILASGQADPMVTAPGFRLRDRRALGPERRALENSENVCLLQSRASTFPFVQLLELYLVYLVNQEGENGPLKNIDLCDQKTAPLTLNSFIYNRYPFPKLDVAGSNPVSRSIFSITCEVIADCNLQENGVTVFCPPGTH
jgi:hypothetical protein